MHSDASRFVHPLRWEDDGLTFIDQRALPRDLAYVRAVNAADVLAAIEAGAIAGARCIDLAAAFGAILARRTCVPGSERDAALAALSAAATPPGRTGIEGVLAAGPAGELDAATELLAQTIAVDRAIAEHGASLLEAGAAIVTLGSSGALATGGLGTVAAAIVTAQAAGKRVHAYVSETRPLMTGRLTAFECARAGVRCTLAPDGAAAMLLRTQPIGAVFATGTAMAANGDLRAELGTFTLAIAAAHHRVPLYVMLPRAAVDRSAPTGDALPPRFVAPRQPGSSGADDPAEHRLFAALEDQTPGNLITAIVTEYGLIRPPYDDALASLATRPAFAFVTRAAAPAKTR